VDLPQYQPLASLPEAVTTSDCLSNGDRAWLLDERDLLLSAYASLDWPLGVGLIHGDAYVGNLLMDGSRAVLGDWEEVSVGPRELDLANTYHTIRFGQPVSVLQEFTEAYGRDITAWPGLAALIAIRDLHTLSSFIKRADCGDEIANDELHYRIGTLRRRDSTALWTSSVPLNS
jgi:aminoglycoside phosphotransferase (APT) family kinase protein